MMPTGWEVFAPLSNWLAAETPVLPALSVLRWAQPLFWGVVMAAGAARLLAGRSPLVRRLAMACAVVWAFLPGSVSPTWWLGLGFQLPSWVTLLLCGAYVVGSWRQATPRQGPAAAPASGLDWLAVLGLLLGALLLADMFVWLPFSFYRWGFSSLAFGMVLAIVVWIWVLAKQAQRQREALWVIGALALYTLTRLPTGNVFDALIDPWLWLVLMGACVRRVWRAARSKW